MPGATAEPTVNPETMSALQKIVFVIAQAARAAAGVGC
jgi:hypothetical protein